jgi:phosphoribosylamine--glycine ligase
MKVLLIGSGGREHALAWRLTRSPDTTLLSAPGSPALGRLGALSPVPVDDLPGLRALAAGFKPDLVVVGPELPLVLGLADLLREDGLAVFGPSKAAARIEGSKVFAKDFMVRHSLPTARYSVFYDPLEAASYLKDSSYPVVVKADGLAAGKGVVICGDLGRAEAALSSLMGDGGSGSCVVVEEYLAGEELSYFALCDGENFLALPAAQDHKSVFDADRGPNTGGMGAYSPPPLATPRLREMVEEQIIRPAVEGLRVEGTPFVGLLYAGLMVTLSGPKLLEFNARFGDTETLALMPLLTGDLAGLLHAAATGGLKGKKAEWEEGLGSVCVVMSAGGYPGEYAKGDPITGLDKARQRPGVEVFEAGVGDQDGLPVTNGGRVLGVTATGKTLKEARDLAYLACSDISFKGAHYRKDIAEKAFKRPTFA